MQINSASVIETLVAIDSQRIPADRLRGLKPSVVRFCFAQGLIKDYVGFGVLISPAAVAVLQKNDPNWKSVSRARALQMNKSGA